MDNGREADGFGLGSLLRRTLQHLLHRPRNEAAEPPVTPGALSMQELRELIGKTDPVILDIGCNDGTHTLGFLANFEHARVYAFEPDARARKRFEANVRDPRAHIFATAVGAIDGVTTFYPSTGSPDAASTARLPDGWDLSGSIRPPKQHLQFHPWCRFGPGTEVAITRLDTWARTHAPDGVDFIWADVQGAEGDLVEGGRETLAKTRFLYTEYSDFELYKGQVKLATLLKMLPDFEVVHRYQDRYQGDILLRNKRLAR
jgi:FkbM family methyltransferase